MNFGCYGIASGLSTGELTVGIFMVGKGPLLRLTGELFLLFLVDFLLLVESSLIARGFNY